MQFSIVIPSYRRPQVLTRTLECLEKQECGFPFELILVNDGPPDELPELNFGKDRRTNWRLIQNETNLKRAATRNRGINNAQGKYVLMLDDDIWAVPGLLQAHYDKQQEIGGGVVVGAVPPAEEMKSTVWHRYISQRFERVHKRLRNSELDFGLFLTGNVSVPAETLRGVGGFDERFKEYSFEDSELGYRLKTSGVKFAHAPEAIGYHFFSEDLRKVCAKACELGRSQLVFVTIHPDLFHTMQCHSVTIMPWKGADIWKNVAKLMIFNRLARFVMFFAVTCLAKINFSGSVLRLLPLLELQHVAQGAALGRAAAARPGVTSQ